MSLSEYFLRDRIESLEERVLALENEKQIKQECHCKHDIGFTQMPNSDYHKCNKCGMAIPSYV